jgi:hypothetical protein
MTLLGIVSKTDFRYHAGTGFHFVSICTEHFPLRKCLTTNWTTGILYLAETKEFSFSLRVRASSEAYPDSYPVGTRGPFPGVKRGRGVTLTTHPI